MANSKEERCIVCVSDVPKSSMQRRVYSEATKHVVQVLCELGGRSFPVSARAALLPDVDDTFPCCPCFRNTATTVFVLCTFCCHLILRLLSSTYGT